MKPLPLLAIDCETGGLIPRQYALLSVGLYDSVTQDEFYTRIRCIDPTKVTRRALAINGLFDYADDRHPTSYTAITNLMRWMDGRRPRIVCGSNIKFDVGFLDQWFRFHEQMTSCRYADLFHYRTFDLHTLAYTASSLGRLKLPYYQGMPASGLDSVLGALCLEKRSGYHNALQDAKMTHHAICEILKLLETPSG